MRSYADKGGSMKRTWWILVVVLAVLPSCANHYGSVREMGRRETEFPRRPCAEWESLAVEAAEKREDIARGDYRASFRESAGGAALVTVDRPSGPEEDAPLKAVDVRVSNGMIDDVGEPRYVARSRDLEEMIERVARQAAASSLGMATLSVRRGVISAKKTESRCLVEVRGVSYERKDLFSRTVSVCP